MTPRILAAAALVGLVLASPAKAEQIPPIMLGEWCYSSEADYYVPRKETTCADYSDGIFTLRRNGWSGHEEDCRVVSIRRVGKSANSTKPGPSDWTPIVRVKARCHGTGDRWNKTIELQYGKGRILQITEK